MKMVVRRSESIKRKVRVIGFLMRQRSLVMFVYTGDDGVLQDAVWGRLQRYTEDMDQMMFHDDEVFGLERRRSYGDDVGGWTINERLMVYECETVEELRAAALSVVL
jgi:hypothetical protein